MNQTMSLAVVFLVGYTLYVYCWINLIVYLYRTKNHMTIKEYAFLVLSSIVLVCFTCPIVWVAIKLWGG